jgi:hypothetical protein
MTPTMTPTNDLPTQLREYNRWRRGDELLEQMHIADIGAMIDAAADRLEELERELAVERELADKLASAWTNSATWNCALPAYEAWKKSRHE